MPRWMSRVRPPFPAPTPDVPKRSGSRSDAAVRTRRRGLLLLVVAASARRYEHTRPVIESGEDFPCRSAISLEGEPTPSEVLHLIGDPLERRPIVGGEAFRYSVRGKYGDHVKLFGLITVSKPHDFWICDVRLEFRNGHLYSITHTRESRGPDGEEREGPTTRIVGPSKPVD